MHAYNFFTLLCVGIGVVAGASDMSLMTMVNDQLSAKMLSEVAREHSDTMESVVISAFNVLRPLSLLSLAAVGQTRTELLNTLGFADDKSILKANSLMNSFLTNTEGIEIKIANRIYIPNDVELNKDFAKKSTIFGTEVKKIDFARRPLAVEAINTWVANQTNNKIKDIIDLSDINKDTRAVLVNALYFVGIWNTPFTKTHLGTFYKTQKSLTDALFMHKQSQFGFYNSKNLNAKVLEMDYVGLEASFVIILPNSVDGLASLLKQIEDPLKLKKAIKGISPKTVRVSIPKFEIESEIDLKEILGKIGVESLFSESAELPKLLKGNENVYVSRAVQKVFISVNEGGTEAAAANEIIITSKSYITPSKDYETFTADHPFVFMIKKGDLILFSGVYHGEDTLPPVSPVSGYVRARLSKMPLFTNLRSFYQYLV